MNVLFISLGCDKNRVDSEVMMGVLVKAGHRLVDDEKEAEAVIVNSCCFIGDAKEESINTLLEMAVLKTTAKLRKLIVTGCLAQRYSEEIQESIPEVDAIVGTTAFDDILDTLNCDDKKVYLKDLQRLVKTDADRLITGENYVSYLKIAEGCDKHCTYCIIPKVRGNYRSVPMEELIDEAEYLVSGGAREIILVAQETTVYGLDLYGKKSLHILLRKLSEIEELEWIRVMYCYPEEIYDELIEEMSTNNKVLHYIDMPVQHFSDRILKAMGRRTTGVEILGIVSKIREKIPDVALRTSLIAGFPGETEDDIDEMIECLKKVRFTRAGVFAYSKEENTAAALMDGQIPVRVKNQRRKRVMKSLMEISRQNGIEMIGKSIPVIVEGYMPDEEIYIGRSYMDAPGIDGQVFFESDEKLLSGDIVNVFITDSKEYDLIGEVTEDEFT